MRQSTLTWRKSSYSQGGGTECVEIARVSDWCAVRDSKNPDGPVLTLTTGSWATLLQAIKAGTHNLPG
ncbi:protein of unknown function [Actinomadura meyerae]|jgi:hypothetical protein|uniref:DUF397 domain-containing protein n=1 Tax=Actinomadura meyerae TaxID=240840 RepID=A0A239KKZ1_9ACTN|nr:DUF397 domain-containing protein [Actinomadura meyerae]SNT18273.1 protein of unknown function [Actinomadura meyerae]